MMMFSGKTVFKTIVVLGIKIIASKLLLFKNQSDILAHIPYKYCN